MSEGDKVLIEELGDVTVEGKVQIEVKHFSEDLTDSDVNLWKTLYNWLKDDFDPIPYKYLILHTTQRFSKEASIAGWNGKSAESRLKTLRAIKRGAEKRFKEKKIIKKGEGKTPSKSLKFQRFVLAPKRRTKLEIILRKFFIDVESPESEQLYKEIQEKYIKGILDNKREDFLNALIGFVEKPHEGFKKRWEITYEDFDKKVGDLIKVYCRETRIFPQKYLVDGYVNKDNMDEYSSYLFVRKIRDIEYEDVLVEAVNDYHATSETIKNEFSSYDIDHTFLDNYTRDVIKVFTGKHRGAKLRCNDAIVDSQIFYDSIINSPNVSMEGFDITPMPFYNGTIHMVLDDKDTKLKWRLVEDD